MNIVSVEEEITGSDSGQAYGNSELLQSLVEEVNRSLESLSGFAGQLGQGDEYDSDVAGRVQSASLVRLFPKEEMEDIARRIRSIESVLQGVPRQ